MVRLAKLAAALLATFPGMAAAAAPIAPPPCLAPAEFAALAQFALPAVIDGARARCAQRLRPDAYLMRDGAALSARYAADGRASWPLAKAAFLKIGGSDRQAGALLQATPDPALQQIVLGAAQGLVVSRTPLDRCPTIDRAVALLAPLPSANTAALFGMLVELGARKDRRLGAITRCPAAP